MTDQTTTISTDAQALADRPKGWKMTTLGEVAELSKSQWKLGDEDQRYIGLEHINQGDLMINGFGNSFKLYSNKFYFNKGDVLFGKLRPYFRKVWKAKFDGVCSTEIWVIRAKNNHDQGFLFYFVANPLFIDKSMGANKGTHMPRADWDYLQNTEWLIPPLPEQQAIAKVLSSLDDKIELLREQNKTLEATAQAIFKEWFVNFNFPGSTGKMIDSELGKIPEGWRVYELRDLFSFVKGKKPNSTSEMFVSGFLPQILIDTLDGGKVIFADSKNTVLSKEEDLIMVMDGASSGRIEFGYSGIIGSTLSLLDFRKECKAVLYFFLKNKEGEIKGSTTGSAIPHTDKEKIYQYSIALPQDSLERFESVLNLFRKKIILNRKSIQTLSTLRNTLLPKLMKGEVRVVELRN